MRFGGVFIGIFVAALAAVFVLRGGSEPAPAPAPQVSAQSENISTVNVYVARDFIPVGTIITSEMLIVQPWPEHLLVPGFARADGKTEVAGMVSRGFFQAQEPIMTNKLVNMNDPSFIAGNLPENMRVITIGTNEIQGLAGFLTPGDRVDVLLTREVEDRVYLDPEDRRTPRPFEITETILTDARVIAVNQHTRPKAEAPTNVLGQPSQPQRYEPPRNVSLAVSPRDAQRLRLAQAVGDVSLTLRGLQNPQASDNLGITFVSDISGYGPTEVGLDPEIKEKKQGAPDFVTVVRGTEIEDKNRKKRQLDLEEGMTSFDEASAGSSVAVSRGALQTSMMVPSIDQPALR